MSDEQVQLEMSEELVNQLKDQLEAVKENPSSVKDTVSAALKEIMIEENSGSDLVSDEDSAKLVDFIVQSLRNHAIKSAGKNTFRFSPHLMGLQLDWPSTRTWACAGIFAVAVRFQIRDQFWIPH